MGICLGVFSILFQTPLSEFRSRYMLNFGIICHFLDRIIYQMPFTISYNRTYKIVKLSRAKISILKHLILMPHIYTYFIYNSI